MTLGYDYPVARLAEPRTVRLVSTKRLEDPVLKRLVSTEQRLRDLEEIDGATSGRLSSQRQGSDDIASEEFVFGVPHAVFINAAFSYFRPRELNRFNGPGRGAWYAALTVETCVAEVAFHLTRELERVNDFHATVQYAEMFASFAGEFVDLRGVSPRPVCLSPERRKAIPLETRWLTQRGPPGITASCIRQIRHPEGVCLVALWPQAVQSVAQGRVLALRWSGSEVPELTVVAG